MGYEVKKHSVTIKWRTTTAAMSYLTHYNNLSSESTLKFVISFITAFLWKGDQILNLTPVLLHYLLYYYYIRLKY